MAAGVWREPHEVGVSKNAHKVPEGLGCARAFETKIPKIYPAAEVYKPPRATLAGEETVEFS
jgi:hypothetical protein